MSLSIVDPSCPHLVSCLFSYPVLTVSVWFGFIGTLPVLVVTTLQVEFIGGCRYRRSVVSGIGVDRACEVG
jgi:hypothetical protein